MKEFAAIELLEEGKVAGQVFAGSEWRLKIVL